MVHRIDIEQTVKVRVPAEVRLWTNGSPAMRRGTLPTCPLRDRLVDLESTSPPPLLPGASERDL